ncbi:MAG: hypothetical protein HQM12_18555, partial [SAR324 cluster bacterium]|nr:hypothetical protein [SAR324 cluster bacterium]
MPEIEKGTPLEVTVIFTDIVSYSTYTDDLQIKFINFFQAMVQEEMEAYTQEFCSHYATGNKHFRPVLIPTGDGMLIILDHNEVLGRPERFGCRNDGILRVSGSVIDSSRTAPPTRTIRSAPQDPG